MNSYNDAEYDRVCDENEELRAEVERLASHAEFHRSESDRWMQLYHIRGETIEKMGAEIALTSNKLADAEKLLREVDNFGEWMDGMFHVELNAHWVDRAKAVMKVKP